LDGQATQTRAWEAALDFGVQRLKDFAFERAIEGELAAARATTAC
jgi:hypothetical protein